MNPKHTEGPVVKAIGDFLKGAHGGDSPSLPGQIGTKEHEKEAARRNQKPQSSSRGNSASFTIAVWPAAFGVCYLAHKYFVQWPIEQWVFAYLVSLFVVGIIFELFPIIGRIAVFLCGVGAVAGILWCANELGWFSKL